MQWNRLNRSSNFVGTDVMSIFSNAVKILKNLLLLFHRLACSESVQYFQFDSEGNLYVFEPGAGSTGPCVKVEPGFEMGDVSQASILGSDSSQRSEFSEVTSSVVKSEISSCVSKASDSKRYESFIMLRIMLFIMILFRLVCNSKSFLSGNVHTRGL